MEHFSILLQLLDIFNRLLLLDLRSLGLLLDCRRRLRWCLLPRERDPRLNIETMWDFLACEHRFMPWHIIHFCMYSATIYLSFLVSEVLQD